MRINLANQKNKVRKDNKFLLTEKPLQKNKSKNCYATPLTELAQILYTLVLYMMCIFMRKLGLRIKL